MDAALWLIGCLSLSSVRYEDWNMLLGGALIVSAALRTGVSIVAMAMCSVESFAWRWVVRVHCVVVAASLVAV